MSINLIELKLYHTELFFLALWDNRCVYHAAIHDHAGQGKRKGVRIVGVGEVPYLDPASKSRRQALAESLEA